MRDSAFGNSNGEAWPDSDIDLMIVGDVSLREISSATRAAGRTLRRVVNPTLYAPDEYAAELHTEDSFVHRAHNGPLVSDDFRYRGICQGLPRTLL